MNMKEKDAKKFELNTKILENFDQVMSIKLDAIEELKITELDRGSKLLNIVSLCANVKTLILEGDQRLNSDKILANIFKPEKLENLVLNNVKLPSENALKRFQNLKMVSLNDIRFCNVKNFFMHIPNLEAIEILNISNTDMAKCSIEILKDFPNLKYLSLEKLQNCKLEKLGFLKEQKKLLKLNIVGNEIPLEEINSLLNTKCTKEVSVKIEEIKGKLEIVSKTSILTVSIHDFKQIQEKVNLKRITELVLKIDKLIDLSEIIPILKKQTCKINIQLKDFSCLSTEMAEKLKEELELQNLEMLNGKSKIEYDIESYIGIRQELENIIKNVSNHVSDQEKFLIVYQYLGKVYAPNNEYTVRGLCEILQNSLKCLNIKSNMIVGHDLENDQKHYWNQVELEGKWYHVDLVLDLKNLSKNKAEYCLLGDKEFLKTHVPKSGKNNYCPEKFDQKLVNVFLKTGLLRGNLLGSYLEMFIHKIKELFKIFQKPKVLVLQTGEETEEEVEEEESE